MSAPVLSSQFLEPLEAANTTIINIHPALPQAYNGAVGPFFFLYLLNRYTPHVCVPYRLIRLLHKECHRTRTQRLDGGQD